MGGQKGENSIKHRKNHNKLYQSSRNPTVFCKLATEKTLSKSQPAVQKQQKLRKQILWGRCLFLLEYAKIAVKLRHKFFSQLTEGKYQKLAAMFLRVQHYTPFFDNLREYQLNIAMSLKSLTFHHGYDSPFNLPKIVV